MRRWTGTWPRAMAAIWRSAGSASRANGRDLSYADLTAEASRFANVLMDHGLRPGESVFAMAGRVPELYAAALGTLKAGMIFTPLFSAFGPEPVRTRMEIGSANVLVTTESIYRRKIAPWAGEIPTLKLILILGDAAPEGCVALGPAMAAAPPEFETVATGPDDPALIHFTSGTTGKPKGAVHVHNAVLYHAYSGRKALGLEPGVKYWCTADPGWVTGTSYGIIAPLVNRVTMLIDEAEFDLDRWYSTVQDERVEVWYSAPTAIRMMMREGAEAAAPLRLFRADIPRQRRRAAEPRGRGLEREGLRPALPRQLVADRNRRHHDRQPSGHAGQAGVHGTAAAGHRGGHRRARGRNPARIAAGRHRGSLRCRPGWPSMMRAYLHEQARYDKCFVDGWYLSGDLAMRDADGYFWFVGPRRRPDQDVGPPDRPLRGRKRPDRTRRGGRGGG